MGPMSSSVYYAGGGYGGGLGGQGAGSPGLSHINQAGGSYSPSPGHGVGYPGIQSSQQVRDLSPVDDEEHTLNFVYCSIFIRVAPCRTA